MKSFERLVEDKNRVIKDCEDFIEELKDISLQTSNISILIKLLSVKKEKYLELKYDNYKESALSVENIDEKIYRQIVILEKQGIFESGVSRKKSNKLLKLKNILEELESTDIKKYDNYSNELRDIYDVISGGNILTLAELLDIDIKQHKKAIYQSYETKISEQLILIKQKYGDKFKESSMYVAEGKKLKITLDKFSTEYKDQGKLKFLLEKAGFIKNHYKSLIILLGLTPFVVYFVLNKNIGYIPMPNSSDIFPVLTSLTLAGLSLLFILYIAPIMQLIIAFCIRDIKSNAIWLVYLISCIATLVLAVLMVYKDYNLSKEEIEIIIFILLIIDIFIYYRFNSKKLNKKDKFFDSLLLALFGIICFLSPFIIFITIVERVDYSSFEDCIFLILFVLLSVILSIFLLLVKDIYSFAFIFYVFIIINCFQLFLLHDKVIQISDLGNIKYRYLSIDKSALYTLPKEINDISEITPFEGKEAFLYIENNLSIIDSNKKDQNLSIVISPKYLSFSCNNKECKYIDKAINIKFHNNVLNYCLDKNCTNQKEEKATVKMKQRKDITYTEKRDGTVWLHNIKALSTLGKFYYLETKDGTRFELDASKIISRQKQER